VVADESWGAQQLFLDGGRRRLQVAQMSDKAAGQNCEEPVVDEVGQLFTDEVGVIVGGLVAPSVDGSILLFQGSRGSGCVYWHSVVAPLAEESSGWVIDVVVVLGKVGLASEGGNEVFPGGGRFKLRHEFGHEHT
jgi:hypothetical protein